MIQGKNPWAATFRGQAEEEPHRGTKVLIPETRSRMGEFLEPRERFQGGGVATPKRDLRNKGLKVSTGFYAKGIFSSSGKGVSREAAGVNGRGGGEEGKTVSVDHSFISLAVLLHPELLVWTTAISTGPLFFLLSI